MYVGLKTGCKLSLKAIPRISRVAAPWKKRWKCVDRLCSYHHVLNFTPFECRASLIVSPLFPVLVFDIRFQFM